MSGSAINGNEARKTSLNVEIRSGVHLVIIHACVMLQTLCGYWKLLLLGLQSMLF